MILAIIIAAWVVIGLVIGFFVGRDSWRNGNQEAKSSWDRYPPHQTGRSIFWACWTALLWPFMVVGTVVLAFCLAVKSIFTGDLATRIARRMWD